MNPIDQSPAVPDVCDIVEYGRDGLDQGPGRYRVTGWLKAHVRARPESGTDMLAAGAMWQDLTIEQAKHALADRLLADIVKPAAVRLAWCPREEATHVALTGVGGAVAAVSACRVVGQVTWSRDMIDEAVAQAIALGAGREVADAHL